MLFCQKPRRQRTSGRIRSEYSSVTTLKASFNRKGVTAADEVELDAFVTRTFLNVFWCLARAKTVFNALQDVGLTGVRGSTYDIEPFCKTHLCERFVRTYYANSLDLDSSTRVNDHSSTWPKSLMNSAPTGRDAHESNVEVYRHSFVQMAKPGRRRPWRTYLVVLLTRGE